MPLPSGSVFGAAEAPASADCQGIQTHVSELLCARLEQAQPTNPRAATTRAWLRCEDGQLRGDR